MSSYHKKAQTSSIPKIIFFALTAVVLIVVFNSSVRQIGEDIPDLALCKATLGLDIGTDEISWLADKIENTCTTVNLDDLKDIKRSDKKKQFIANRMAQSYWVTWEGKTDLWDTKEGALAQLPGYDCLTLFKLDYRTPKEEQIISKEQLNEYIIKETYTLRGQTYKSYITEEQTGTWFIANDLEPGKQYAVSVLNPHKAEVTILDNTIGSLWGIGLFIADPIDNAIEEEIEEVYNGGKQEKTIILFSDLETALENKCNYEGVLT